MNQSIPKVEPTEIVKERDNPKLAMWLFLGGEVIFFTTLILTFVLMRIEHPADYPAFRTHLSIPIIAVNTFILITSSYFVVRALSGIQEGKVKPLRNNLIAVLVLGALFLGGQAFEWTTLFRDGVSIKDTFGGPFFAVTGIHGTHVLIGLIWSVYILVYGIKRMYSKNNHLGVENFGLYWHFVDIVWIVLFTVIYLI